MGDEHAVRWAQREYLGGIDIKYSKWHWTENSDKTICGRVVNLINDKCNMLPQTNNMASKVSCKRCLVILRKK